MPKSCKVKHRQSLPGSVADLCPCAYKRERFLLNGLFYRKCLLYLDLEDGAVSVSVALHYYVTHMLFSYPLSDN